MLVLENPAISFVPNLPRHKKSKGSQAFPLRHQSPPRMKRCRRPLKEIEVLQANPLLEEPPKANGESTIDKKMVHGLQSLVA
jgi:hypothetical protein